MPQEIKETVRNVATKELISYAVLTANYNQKPDSSYLDNFVEFVSYALATGAGGTPQTAGQIATGITRDFGLVIPSRAVQKILTRGCSKGRYVIVSRKEPSTYRVTEAHSREVKGLEESVSRFDRSLSMLIAKLEHFTNSEHSDNAETLLSDASGHLTAFIEANVGSLLSTVLHSGTPQAERKLDGSVEFVISSFIENLHNTDAEGFAQFAELTKGVILAGVLNIGTTDFSKPLTNLTFVLDGPLLLSALGYRGEEFMQALTQTIELALACGAKVTTFEHSVEEARAVLEYTEQALRGIHDRIGLAGDVELNFRAQKMRPADVAQRIQALDQNLRALQISIQIPPDVSRRRNIDEKGLEELLEVRINYRNPSARILDVKSIAAIDQLRGSGTSGTFESSRYIFISDNDKLAQITHQHTREDHRWPLIMTTSDLVSMLWVRRPDAGSQLPDTQLLAVAHAGLQPLPSMWKHYLEELVRLESAGKLTSDEALHLRTAPEARSILRRTTAGGEIVTPKLVEDVRKKVEDQATAPVRAQLEMTTAALASKEVSYKQTQSELEATLKDQVAKDSDIQALTVALNQITETEVSRKKRIETSATKRAHRICISLRWITGVIFVVAVIATMFRQHLPESFQEIAVTVEVVIGAAVILITLFGINVLTWISRFETWLARKFSNRSLLALGYEI